MKPRYELRYFVSPDQALRIRDFVREYMDFDEHSVGKSEFCYPVHTLHLDSDDWKIYWGTVRGDQDRWKLRLHIFCMREAYESEDGNTRVTLDRSIYVLVLVGSDLNN